ncbi:hypothetical protein N7510_004440 [Penicillium lagena]|uniref:uncharacterized protein n=1 Tax=Penicillium lagena TaxID=94218 RepID=UPI002541510E|nr:uncharacterized protein N7510_004440 [Penicillium lagena]KAJ5620456.1 hypothetical protein N7510_004440 [Penicillium lagena]
MARLSSVFVLFALLAATIVTAYNQTLEEENATCDNNCFFNSFPGGSCTNDAQCMCDKQEYREAYFCCMGKNCNPNVLPALNGIRFYYLNGVHDGHHRGFFCWKSNYLE